MIRVAINGFGRIGRLAFRQMLTSSDFDVVAINSRTGTPEDFAYLAKYDSVHGTFHEDEISFDDNSVVICNSKHIKVLNESDPVNLPWGDLNIDLVLECTGAFTSKEGASAHLKAGAKKVLISAPGKDEMPTIVANVNDNSESVKESIVSASSCTTNCLAPVLNILESHFGIERGMMCTIHAYTSDQELLDNSHKKGILSRRGRAAGANIVPTTTGAAKSIGLVIPSLKGKLDGLAYRVPTFDGSVVEVNLELKRNVTKDEINNCFKANQNETIRYTEDPIVSSDVIGKKFGATVDGLSTMIVDDGLKQMVKVVAWYDNEYGYTAQMLRTAKKMFD